LAEFAQAGRRFPGLLGSVPVSVILDHDLIVQEIVGNTPFTI